MENKETENLQKTLDSLKAENIRPRVEKDLKTMRKFFESHDDLWKENKEYSPDFWDFFQGYIWPVITFGAGMLYGMWLAGSN